MAKTTARRRRRAPRRPGRDGVRRGIFVSYRRDDAAGDAGRLADHLVAALGETSVFLDVADIAAGDDWRSRLDTALDACDTMLVVIGRQWLSIPSAATSSLRRLDEPDDLVAWEVARGLTRGLRVVQVLVQEAAPLEVEALPPAVAALAMRQAVTLRHERFAADVQTLVAQVQRSRRARSAFAGDWRAVDFSRWARPLDSGPEGTCAALTIVNALELLLARAGAPQPLSARYLYEKTIRSEQRLGDTRMEGIYLRPALFVASFFGVPAESTWPYEPGKPALPPRLTWDALEASIGWSCRGEFFRADGLADAVRHLGAGRPVIAACRIHDDVLSRHGPSAEVGMPRAASPLIGLTTVLLTAFDPAGPSFRCLFTWGTKYGDHGFARMSLDVARRLIDPEQLWSVDLARETVDALREQRATDAAPRSRRKAPSRRRAKERSPGA